jgi:hypothetical protein
MTDIKKTTAEHTDTKKTTTEHTDAKTTTAEPTTHKKHASEPAAHKGTDHKMTETKETDHKGAKGKVDPTHTAPPSPAAMRPRVANPSAVTGGDAMTDVEVKKIQELKSNALQVAQQSPAVVQDEFRVENDMTKNLGY